MTAKDLIIEYITEHGDATSEELHDYVQSKGLQRVSSCATLCRMFKKGEVIKEGYHKDFVCWLAAGSNRVGAGTIPRQLRDTSRWYSRENSVNVIFDECRTLSYIYQVDQLLAGVRSRA